MNLPVDVEYRVKGFTPIKLPDNTYRQPSIRYTTTVPKTTGDPLDRLIVNGIEWIFQNPEKAVALAAGIATTVIVYKMVTSK